MPGKRFCFLLALWTCTAFAQLKDQTFYFKYADSKDLNQYANAIKTVGDIQSVTADDANKATSLPRRGRRSSGTIIRAWSRRASRYTSTTWRTWIRRRR
jgi:hypothetical protein